jgi:hypothetical protein
MPAHRVFVSYSHKDLPLVQQIVAILQSNGLSVLWDQDFAFGHGFQEQIRDFIAHAHVFLPVITEAASKRGWVHEELGYAMALNVPVLPIAVGALPGQMIEQLQAIKMGADAESLRRPLRREVFEQLVASFANPSLAMYQCADQQEERSTLMARYARAVVRLGGHGRVRQRESHSAFSIPEQPITHPLWAARYGGLRRSTYQKDLLREERLALGDHANKAGVSLILDLNRSFDQYGPAVHLSRLEVLRNFLSGLPDDSTRVAFTSIPPGDSLVMVGDWFVAQSLAGAQGSGYRQTVFSRHAPNMQRCVDVFDAELDHLLVAAKVDPDDSRKAAVEQISRQMKQIGS